MKGESIRKYRPFPRFALENRQWPDRQIEEAPLWCSVDLRDGNQSLPIPMNIEEKVKLFQLLVSIGFKQIEVGFPSASDTEFAFMRRLVEDQLIPDDVTVQVLVQAREHLIRRTFESLQGCKKAIVHLYNSTSPLQRRVTFNDASREKILGLAVEGTRLVKELATELEGTELTLQYSPESYSDTELDFAKEICEAVMDVWQPTPENRMILNLPATVEWFTPNMHADQIEWFCRNVKNRDSVIISLHTHNDRGTGTAATELGLLAGADRVEGTLFGNGERTGNLDLTTVALNMNSHGLDTGLDFSNLNHVRQVYEQTTRMTVHDRHPYAGELVFTAFSGSHQDAIKKGFDRREKDVSSDPDTAWGVPYLTIDPKDIGRPYEEIIRINSQSGKGGVAYILEHEAGFDLPKTMHPVVGKFIYDLADSRNAELSSEEIKDAFFNHFTNTQSPVELLNYELIHHTTPQGVEFEINADLVINGDSIKATGKGNGPINAMAAALENIGVKTGETVVDYRSHALRGGSDAESAAYIQLKTSDDQLVWGCGFDSSIETAGLQALITALNAVK